MNNQSLKKILILATILAVPGFLYYLLQEKGKNRYRPLSIFGPKEVASTFHTRRGQRIPDTIYHVISDFKLTDQSGNVVLFPPDSNHISVFNFFYTRCADCKQMNRSMGKIVEQYEHNKMLQFYSISIDPENDSPAVLKSYSAVFNIRADKWRFLTGDSSLIFKLAKNDFRVNAMPDKENPGNIIHSRMLILVDPQKRIRGYYDSSSKEQIDKLADEIKVLIAEGLRQVTGL
ncbi:protein SCO1/2 [Arcticibacter tournemirensis]|uniref:SCO family protein n=1 Tax=Arcticibacter tournemirensis TaxID=699437 RepID=A0A5M9GYR7_9SPHI|nr:SCO family protein [Arcticibacter tournemirensis]KAA8478921.1 SCO family protein [Arcticibacter tournemirensis]TQM49142.1 protein SCO1/2 [Arcticibacter tournemirensis]